MAEHIWLGKEHTLSLLDGVSKSPALMEVLGTPPAVRIRPAPKIACDCLLKLPCHNFADTGAPEVVSVAVCLLDITKDARAAGREGFLAAAKERICAAGKAFGGAKGTTRVVLVVTSCSSVAASNVLAAINLHNMSLPTAQRPTVVCCGNEPQVEALAVLAAAMSKTALMKSQCSTYRENLVQEGCGAIQTKLMDMGCGECERIDA